MVFHWSLSDSKYPQVSRTLLSILADLNNAVIWMVAICPSISFQTPPTFHPASEDRFQSANYIIIIIIVIILFERFFH